MNEESEKLFFNQRDKLIRLTKAINPRLNTLEKAEGADIKSDRWEYKGSAGTDMADLLFYPYDEIKVVNEFLIKDWKYNKGDPSGTIPFEIFHKWSYYPSPVFPYAGGGAAIFNPDVVSQQKHKWNVFSQYEYNVVEKVYRPGTLDFFLYHGEQLYEKPFACVAFERIEDLKARIKDCLPSDLDLENWDLPPLSDPYWKRYVNFSDHGYFQQWDWDRGGMIQNCWHIPLRSLADIATITLIGNQDLDTERKYKPLQRLEENRLRYVQQQSGGRIIPN